MRHAARSVLGDRAPTLYKGRDLATLPIKKDERDIYEPNRRAVQSRRHPGTTRITLDAVVGGWYFTA